MLASGNVPFENTIKRQVLPHAPSPTITSLRLSSAIAREGCIGGHVSGQAPPQQTFNQTYDSKVKGDCR